MNRPIIGKTTLALVILIAALAAAQAQAQTDLPVNYQWTAPTTGAPVAHYVIEHSVNGGDWLPIGTSNTNSYTLTASVGDSHQIRVVGIDADSRIGVYSVASAAYVPMLDPPGQPGQPIIF